MELSDIGRSLVDLIPLVGTVNAYRDYYNDLDRANQSHFSNNPRRDKIFLEHLMPIALNSAMDMVPILKAGKIGIKAAKGAKVVEKALSKDFAKAASPYYKKLFKSGGKNLTKEAEEAALANAKKGVEEAAKKISTTNGKVAYRQAKEAEYLAAHPNVSKVPSDVVTKIRKEAAQYARGQEIADKIFKPKTKGVKLDFAPERLESGLENSITPGQMYREMRNSVSMPGANLRSNMLNLAFNPFTQLRAARQAYTLPGAIGARMGVAGANAFSNAPTDYTRDEINSLSREELEEIVNRPYKYTPYVGTAARTRLSDIRSGQ